MTSAYNVLNETWDEVAARIIAATGCMVMSSKTPLKVGEIIREVGTRGCIESIAEQPLVVVGEATAEDWIRQVEVISPLCNKSFSATLHFYFVETD
jgi:hypothetical protein